MRKFKFEEVNSTNEVLKTKKDIEQWDTIITEVQTAGKGRRGNVWESPKGAALFSFALKEDKLLSEKDYSLLPLIAGRAMLEGLNNIEKQDYKFKWPNDIYVNDKKISGILIEKVGEFYIIGVGVNVNNTEFTGNSKNGTSLKDITGKNYEIEEIIDMLIMIFKKTWARYVRGQWESLLGDINEKNYLKGKNIEIVNGETTNGVAGKVLENGRLEVEIAGEKVELMVGDIHIKL